MISIVLFTLVGYQGENFFLRLGSRLLLLPVVAGISYEALKALAHSESRLARILRWPGMQMQRLTTRPPTDEMLEVAIVSMNVALHGLPRGAKPRRRDTPSSGTTAWPTPPTRRPPKPLPKPPPKPGSPAEDPPRSSPPGPPSDMADVRQTLLEAARALERAGVPDPRLDAEWLLAHVLAWTACPCA